MYQKLLYFTVPLVLTGCIGSMITGQTEYIGEEYPDIRKVPERAVATTPRGLHEGEEKAARSVDLKKLKQDWEKITERNQALREEAFSPQEGAQSAPIPRDDKDAL